MIAVRRGKLMAPSRLIGRVEVERRCGMSRSSIYRKMRDGAFPEPVKISVRAVRWPESEIEAWIASRPRATSDLHQ